MHFISSIKTHLILGYNAYLECTEEVSPQQDQIRLNNVTRQVGEESESGPLSSTNSCYYKQALNTDTHCLTTSTDTVIRVYEI